MKKRDKNIIRTITDVADAHVYYGTESIAKWAMDLYLSGEVDEVITVYTRFETVLNYVPCVDRVLPVVIGSSETDEKDSLKYEPDIDAFIDHIMPLYLHMNFFRAISNLILVNRQHAW